VYNSPLAAYQQIEKTTVSGRETEARVLTMAAAKLKACQKNWDDDSWHEQLKEALEYNQKIWSVFQAELVKPDNPLPDDLKQNLLQLSVFIDKRIFEIMAYPTPEKLNIIININRNIAAGLRGSPSDV
jgi:flagellar protein FlaF